MHWLRRNRGALRALTQPRTTRTRLQAPDPLAETLLRHAPALSYAMLSPWWSTQSRTFAMHASILSQMDLLANRYDELSNELSNNDGSFSAEKITKLSIEMADLEPKVLAVKELRAKQAAVKELDEMIAEQAGETDPDAIELRVMAEDERRELLAEIEELEGTVTRLMLPRDADDDKSSMLEIRAGTGGDEACLFANDILKMYQKVALAKGWNFEILSITETDLGGCKECVCSITGRGAYGRMKFESGVHRVQRVPVNDVRVHTSAISVVVLPEVEAIEMEIDPKDLRIDVYRASGAGGQHVNTTESAVRITHLPTGIVAAVQDERSQHQNKAKAMKILSARVYDGIRRQRDAARHDLRASQIGSGDRSERIRTYNFPQSRISDHRVNVTVFGIERMLNGEHLDEIVDALVVQEQNTLLQQLE
ncbi:Peptide chain release factor 1, partial [Globisporangium splendens]